MDHVNRTHIACPRRNQYLRGDMRAEVVEHENDGGLLGEVLDRRDEEFHKPRLVDVDGHIGVCLLAANRPSPQPPSDARPDQLSVTQIKTLIRDPYAIYARKVLRLDPLDPLTPNAEARLKGEIIHKILERFVAGKHSTDDRATLLALAEEEFTTNCPWPTIRAQWMARFVQIADLFLADEAARQADATPTLFEQRGEAPI